MSVRDIVAVASRLILQVIRDRRLLAMMFVAPVVVMTLVALVIRNDEKTYRIGIDARGPMSLFIGDFVTKLEKAGFEVEELMGEGDPRDPVRERALDGVLVVGERFLVDRAEGRPGKMVLLVEGADPMAELGIAGDLQESLADLVDGLPVLLDAECPAVCAEGVNTSPPEVDLQRISGDGLDLVDFFLPGIIPFIAFFFGYLLTALAFLRERSGGTLERLLAAPIRKHEIVAGYFLGFLLFGLLQSAVILAIAVGVLKAPNEGGILPLTGLLVLAVATASGLGLFLSTFARSEIQVAQFIPLVILPQIFLCGLIWPVQDLPEFLQPVSYALPLTYATDAAREMMIRGDLAAALPGSSILGLFCLGSVLLASLTMRRRVV
jgi:ABC-2 type transport system permease protein